MILYVLICGKLPFATKTDKGVIRKKEEVVKDIKDGKISFNFSPWTIIEANTTYNGADKHNVIELIKRMLTVNPEDRITVGEILTHPWVCKIDKHDKEVVMNPFNDEYISGLEGVCLCESVRV